MDRLAHAATLLLTGLLSATVLVAIYTVLVREHIQWYGWLSKALFHGLPMLAAVILLVCLRLEDQNRVKVTLGLISLGLPLLVVELVLTLLAGGNPEAGVDVRSYSKVLTELRREGLPATWNLLPRQFLSHELYDRSGRRLIPLGGIGNRLIVFCNETGEWVLYQSDRHGFHNPRDTYSEADLSIAAIGDSFLQGSCVEPEQSLVELLRRRYSKILNLGMSGNGPLLQLASLREYARPSEPKVVLWFYYEGNDLKELEREKAHQLLMSYLSSEFSQDLFARREEVQQALVDFERTEVPVQIAHAETKSWKEALWQVRLHPVVEIITFSRIREELQWSPTGRSKADARDLDLLEKILARAKTEVTGWGGKMYFVYLCEKSRYVRFGSPNPYRKEVLALVERLVIPIIDACLVFENEQDPLSLFHGHYTAEGYALIADAILATLEAEPLTLAGP